MKKIITVLVFGLMLSGVASSASAMDARGFSCGLWVQIASDSAGKSLAETPRSLTMAYLMGYLKGISYATNKDFLNGTDTQSILLFMDNYCKANPLKSVDDGAIVLYWELVKQKGL